MEANTKEKCDFNINYKNENWHITAYWLSATRETCWYEGETLRDGVSFYRLFAPTEIDVPEITNNETTENT